MKSVLHSLIMKLILCCIILSLYSTTNGQSSADKEYYTGAIVEYATIWNNSHSPADNIRRNVDEYLVYIREAKEQDADIIVFPEVGLVTIFLPKTVADLQPYTIVIPDPKDRIVVPCENKEWADVLIRLSCAAKENQIYVVMNTPERQIIGTSGDGDEIVIYNTNVVFDRNGALIARYRKQNLFVEPGFSSSDSQDFTTFETDFGVTFGTFICFDILFANPGLKMLRENLNVTDIVYPTAWFSELPFATAVPMQAGWARANGVNLLAADYVNPDYTNGGSGIYQTDGDISYSVPVTSETTMIVKQIKKIKQRPILETIDSNTAIVTNENKIDRSLGKMQTMKQNLSNFTTLLINDNNIDEQQVCHGTFCCTFTVRFSPIENADYHYRMVVYDGPREKPLSLLMETIDIQVCGLVACKTASPDSCGERNENSENPHVFQEISITGTFRKDDNTGLNPTNTLYDLSILKPSDFEYRVSGSDSHRIVQMRTTQEVQQLLGFGIFGVTKNPDISSSSCCSVLPLIIVSIVTLFVIIRKCT